MNNYRYAGIETYDINNGKGFGVTLFVQGCSHHCEGCHNPQTWDFNGGYPLTSDVINKLIEMFNDNNLVRLTISGGEPFDNLEVTYSVASIFKSNNPNKKLWIYTGYTYDKLASNVDNKIHNILSICDVLVDGQFQIDKRDLSLGFRGSSNQRIIDVQQSLQHNTVCVLEDQ